MDNILLVDDDKSLRGVLGFALREDGYEVEEAEDGEIGLARYRESLPDLVITDLKMPRMGGLELLEAVIAEGQATPVIVLTAFGTIEQAVEAMKLGAFNYLTKPYNREELRVVVKNALERARLQTENRELRHRLREREEEMELVYISDEMGSLVEMTRRVAPSDATILITGESGTGKELVARLLHRHSERADRPMIAINCGALPRELIESELFGHKRGAFTGATREKKGKFQDASGGTLFLDEIGELPLDLQSKLLRVLETGQVDMLGGGAPVQVDIRLVAATNKDLGKEVASGNFREDLFFRLNVIPLHVTPLRTRPADISLLWAHFVEQFAGGETVDTSPELIDHLSRSPWRGNVRELKNLCQRMVLLRKGETLRLEDLPAGQEKEETRESPLFTAAGSVGDLPDKSFPLRDMEKEIIRRALEKHGGNKSRTARYLEIPRHVLLYRIEKYDLEKQPEQKNIL